MGEISKSRYVVEAGWPDVPHLEAGDMEGVAVWKLILKAIEELLDKSPPGNQSAVH